MAKKKRSVPKAPSQDLFTKHNNLKWLLPVFVIVALGFMYVLHHAKEELSVTEDTSIIKQDLKNKIQTKIDNNSRDDNITVSITPFTQY